VSTLVVSALVGILSGGATRAAANGLGPQRAGSPRGSLAESHGATDVRLEQALAVWHAEGGAHALRALLDELVRRAPARARVIELGPGRSGRTVLALEVGALGAPGVVVVPATLERPPAQGSDPQVAVDALLGLARACLEASDPTFSGRLERGRLVFVVGARADLLEPALPADRWEVTQNFPVDLDLAARAGGGAYPLAVPEARTLALWLDAHPELFAAAVIGGETIDPADVAIGESSSDAELTKLTREALLAASLAPTDDKAAEWGELAYGCFSRHARLRTGLAVIAFPDGSVFPDGSGPVPSPRIHEQRRAGLAALLDAAPELDFAADARPRPIGDDLWQLDLVLTNVGALATANVVHERERRPRGIEIATPGFELVMGSMRIRGGAYEVVEPRPGEGSARVLRLGDLVAGAEVELRLFVRAPAGADVQVLASAPRAHSGRIYVTPQRER